MDNSDPGFSILNGDWGTCQAGNCEGVAYGADFRYAAVGCQKCVAQYKIRVAVTGTYDVWAWWPMGADRAIDTPYRIISDKHSKEVKVDQRHTGNIWYRLGTLNFNAGEVVMIEVTGTQSGYVKIDAVAISPAGNVPPAP